jgi:uncharacterized membrane protein YbhN (UPF0104 family)
MNRPALAERLSQPPRHAPRPWWPPLRRALTVVFLVGVAALLLVMARRVDWGEVLDVIAGYPVTTLLAAAAAAACSHLVYTGYDLVGRAWTGHRLPTRQVMAVAFVSYAFTLNLGTMVGGVGLRLRLYSRLGLATGDISRVVGLSMATNWLGYLVIAGAVFAAGVIVPPPGWDIGAAALRAMGVAMLIAGIAYLVVCARAKRREWTIRGHEISLPPLRLAALQIALSCANWLLMATIIFVLMQGRVAYPTVLGVLLIAAVAGAAAHIPGGLGVLEAVFIALLVPPLTHGAVLGALIAYRAVYNLAPLLLACGVYLLMEATARRGGAG